MNRRKLSETMRKAVNVIYHKKGYVSTVDVLLYINYLENKDYENWRIGKVFYLEKVLRGNLSQMSFLVKELQSTCLSLGLNPSWTSSAPTTLLRKI